MGYKYSSNITIQIMIALLKGHGIRKVVVSPGTTNLMFVASIQNDSWFEIKSSADERSAAYIACGWAAETNEPVVISCTGATASRNYLPGLTEAFYRKLPVLALTSINDSAIPGNNIPQIIDRARPPIDTVKWTVTISDVYDQVSKEKCILSINKALLELTHNGGGPVHINLMTKMSKEFNVSTLPSPRVMKRYLPGEVLPQLIQYKKIAIYIGSHISFSNIVTESIEKFCEKYSAFVICDHTSNYQGKHKFLSSFLASQEYFPREKYSLDLIIDLGEVSGDYYQFRVKETWRLSVDGEVKDRFKRLTNIFQMDELQFFNYYNAITDIGNRDNGFYKEIKALDISLRERMPELPFSNIWISKVTSQIIPDNSTVHFGILNSLRAWNFFEISESVSAYCNVGGFGIDGGVSTLIGASFADESKLYFGFFGDLAFFYDMNALGNRHIGNNVRIMVINNGKGTEFRNYSHPAAVIGDEADAYVAAAGHYGNKSMTLLCHYAEDLGFKYFSARNKEEFNENIEEFTDPQIKPYPILMEVFTDSEYESTALKIIRSVIPQPKTKAIVNKVIGTSKYNYLAERIRRK